jgi:Protein of unknown function (DUF2505)
MQFSQTHEFAGSVAEVLQARTQADVREAACKSSGALSWKVTVTPGDGGARVEVERVMAPDVPALFKSMVGDSITVVQTEQWLVEANGDARASVKVVIAGKPASMTGSSVIAANPTGTGSVERTEGDVTVAVPIIGRKVEPEIVKVLATALSVEQQAAAEWLSGR